MRSLITICILLVASVQLHAQAEWVLKRDEDGIKVYTKNSDNSSFKSIKVECDIDARPSQLVAFLLDVDRQCDWVCNYKASHLVKKVCDSEIIFYSEVSVPWPCTNRDYVSHITFTQPHKGLLLVLAHSEPDMVPKQDGKVRIVKSNARWEVTSITPTKQHINYVVQFDPAGAIPAWLVNMFITKAPYETFSKLRKGVMKPEYRNAHYDFVKE